MPTQEIKFLDEQRAAELWAAVQEEIEKKLDAVGTDHVTSEDVANAITEALKGCVSTDALNTAIAEAVSGRWSKQELRVMTAEELQAILV